MSSVRGRRGGSPADGRRTTGRAPPRALDAGRCAPALRSSAASRPGPAAPRPAAGADARPSAAVRRRPLFTGRAVLLGALVLLLALTLAGPLRQYLAGPAGAGPARRRGPRSSTSGPRSCSSSWSGRPTRPTPSGRPGSGSPTCCPATGWSIVVDGERGRGRRRRAAGEGRRADAVALVRGAAGVASTWPTATRPSDATRSTDDERAVDRAPARPPAAGARGRRAPLPVRPARRRRDLAAAGGRHARSRRSTT